MNFVLIVGVILLSSCHLKCNYGFIPPLQGMKSRNMLLRMSTITPNTATETTGINDCYYIGIDLGTSGARISIIGPDEKDCNNQLDPSNRITTVYNNEIYSHAVVWNEIISSMEETTRIAYSVEGSANDTVKIGNYDEAKAWCDGVEYLFACAAKTMTLSKMQQVQAICISGTSSSCLLIGPKNENEIRSTADYSIMEPTRGMTARMYNYAVKDDTVQQLLKQYVPDRHTAQSMTGTLAKLLSWHIESPVQQQERLCHQADYIIHQWLQPASIDDSVSICSDWHNCLKLGYDVQSLQWPSWLVDCLDCLGITGRVLPTIVVSPGAVLGIVRPAMATKYGLSERAMIVGGTTDSNAAFFAAIQDSSRTMEPGIAVTSLGSTVALKQLSTSYVEDATCGVYSHRFPSTFPHMNTNSRNGNNNINSNVDKTTLWLVGGASNVGCAILRHLNYSNIELDELSQEIDPDTDSPYTYYPLLSVGERFPIADRDKEPLLEPIPNTRREYLHGLLQGISDVERDGYIVLGTLGVQPSIPIHVWTCGGGSRNGIWNLLRQRRLNEGFMIRTTVDPKTNHDKVLVQSANNVEASYGAAILAASSFFDRT